MPMIAARRVICALAAVLALGGCDGGGPPGPERTLAILSGSENQALEPIVAEFCRREGWSCPVTYQGSVDIRLALEDPALTQDAVWPAHTRWVELGDRQRRVKHLRSIMQSPVVFAVARPEAERLGLIDRQVTTPELVELVQSGRFRFLMTSATQSNSGFSAYIAMLSALAGSPEVLTADMLDDPAVVDRVRALLSGVARTAGSSGWLADLYRAGAGDYDAMVNYESLVIETNRILEQDGLPPLYAVYPADGVAVSDSPLGFVARADNAAKEAFFLRLQEHLLSAPVQRRLLALGRRTGFGGTVEAADPQVFRADWGIDAAAVLPAIRFPAADTIDRALALYQEALRRPSLLALCLDFSGSMTGAGETELKAAITRLFDPEISRRFLLQATANDVFLAIPFSSVPGEVMTARGPEEATALARRISALQAAGGTDIYACAERAIEEIRKLPDFATHTAAVILLTDGRSQGDPAGFQDYYQGVGADIPVFAITFGDADERQLDEVARLSRARVFDGHGDLTSAFRQARGYN